MAYKKFDFEEHNMELIKAIEDRRSIRKFEDREVPNEVIEEIVKGARWSPSWKNFQAVRYIVLKDKEEIARLATPACVYNFDWNVNIIKNAPAVLVLTYVAGQSGFEKDGSFSTKKGDGFEMFDAGIASQTFCLLAHEKGLGTVILGYFDEDEIRKVIAIPEGQKVAAIIPMGYPAVNPEAPKRKEVEEILTII